MSFLGEKRSWFTHRRVQVLLAVIGQSRHAPPRRKSAVDAHVYTGEWVTLKFILKKKEKWSPSSCCSHGFWQGKSFLGLGPEPAIPGPPPRPRAAEAVRPSTETSFLAAWQTQPSEHYELSQCAEWEGRASTAAEKKSVNNPKGSSLALLWEQRSDMEHP